MKIAIEIDGDSHDYSFTYDSIRQKELEEYGIMVIRFDDLEVKQRIDSVVREIVYHIQDVADRKQTPL